MKSDLHPRCSNYLYKSDLHLRCSNYLYSVYRVIEFDSFDTRNEDNQTTIRNKLPSTRLSLQVQYYGYVRQLSGIEFNCFNNRKASWCKARSTQLIRENDINCIGSTQLYNVQNITSSYIDNKYFTNLFHLTSNKEVPRTTVEVL